jgi:ubiquinone/menaquinone biosynthesis C-methylase UbiE
MADMESLAQMALLSNCLREPLLRSAIQALHFPLGSRGLDAGCGLGLQTLLLAESVGVAGHVTGLDLYAELLEYARELVSQAGMSERISFHQGDLNELPFESNIFDWAWSVDCVGYAPIEPVPLIKELARVVKRGGRVAILAWSSERLLPGYPLLEARLQATSAGIAPFSAGMKPESMEFILGQSDYYAFFTYTMFSGLVMN